MADKDLGALPSEEWLIAPGFDQYIVSSEGRVRHRKVNAPILKGDTDRYGYRRLQLEGKRVKVHRLVCEAFKGPPPANGLDCAHLDGNRLNNSADNLMWATRSENVMQAVAHGTHPRGLAKFTQEQVGRMRCLRSQGWSERRIAAEFGCSPGTAHKILAGERYVG